MIGISTIFCLILAGIRQSAAKNGAWMPVGEGINASVSSSVANGSVLYVGGGFRFSSGSEWINGVALWDGANWRGLGQGVGGHVSALAVDGTLLYAGGSFSTAGGEDVQSIAVWDGFGWASVGEGVAGDVSSLAVNGTSLIAGGAFTSAGGQDVGGIAIWDGESWSGLDGGTFGTISVVGTFGALVVAGGSFSSIGGTSAAGVAVWDGEKWASLGSGISGQVNALSSDGIVLYVGGAFTNAGGKAVSNVAIWDGNDWNGLGQDVDGTDGTVSVLLSSGASLFVGGSFSTAGGQSAQNIAIWNGDAWGPLGDGVLGEGVWTAEIVGFEIFIGGSFVGNNIARLFREWSGLGNSKENIIALAISGSKVYAAQYRGTLHQSNVHVWNGNDWSSLGNGVDSRDPTAYLSAIAVVGSEVFVGGSFSEVESQQANNMAMWNGSVWGPVDGGVSGDKVDCAVYSLQVVGPVLYVGGAFEKAGNITSNNIALWNGTAWNAVGGGIPGNDLDNVEVAALAAIESMVFVGGSFLKVGNLSVNNIACWDGFSWSALGEGVKGGSVTTLAVADGILYAGGGFSTAGASFANGIAFWDGATWTSINSGVLGPITLATVGSNLFLGGQFITVGGQTARNIAMWDGKTWTAIGDGIDGAVVSMVGNGSDLYVGGNFDKAGFFSAVGVAVHSTFRTTTPQSSSHLIHLPSSPTTSLHSSTSTIATITAILAVSSLVFLLVLRSQCPRTSQTLKSIDFFTLDHLTPLGKPTMRFQTPFGGIMTVSMAIAVIGVCINTLTTYFGAPVVINKGLIPQAQAKLASASTTFQLGIIISSAYLVSCPSTEPWTIPSKWTIHTDPVSTVDHSTTCTYFAQCKSCSTTTPSTFVAPLPFYFTAASITIAAPLASFTNEPSRFNSITYNWTTPNHTFVSDVSVGFELATDARILQDTTAAGCILSLGDVLSTTSSDPQTVTFSINFRPSGFTSETDLANQSTIEAQALSILIAALTGVVGFFRLVIPTSERLSQFLVNYTKRKSLNFADAIDPTDEAFSDLQIEVSPLQQGRPKSDSTVEWPQRRTLPQ